MFQKPLSLVLAALLILPVPGWSWGNEGHRLVGDIAEASLAGTPKVMGRVHAIFGATTRLRDLATCADRIRDFVREHGGTMPEPCRSLVAKFATPPQILTKFEHADKWHFINIPFDKHQHSLADVKTFCGPNLCAPDRIEHYGSDLDNPAAAVQAEAILFLAHLVGDVHQPLHSVVRNHDSGGNTLFVDIFGDTFKLHHVWDDEIIIRMKNAQGVALTTEAARSQFLSSSLPPAGTTNPWQWGLDAFQLATTVAYVNNGAQIPFSGGALDSVKYLKAADPVTQKQLRLAGVRLAAVLKEHLNQ